MKETLRVKEGDMSEVAKELLKTLESKPNNRAKLLFLDGDLGAGKTTFTKELAHHLGVDKEEVHSPTFILKKEYRTQHPFFRKLVHIDAYRFETKEEGKVLRLRDDLIDPATLVVIEWPYKMTTAEPDIVITLKVIDDETRDMEIDL